MLRSSQRLLPFLHLQAAMNTLEQFCYTTKDRMREDEETIAAVTTEEQRQELETKLSENEEWLYEDGFDASTKE